MPRVAPVMTATLPERSKRGSFVMRGRWRRSTLLASAPFRDRMVARRPNSISLKAEKDSCGDVRRHHGLLRGNGLGAHCAAVDGTTMTRMTPKRPDHGVAPIRWTPQISRRGGVYGSATGSQSPTLATVQARGGPPDARAGRDGPHAAAGQ